MDCLAMLDAARAAGLTVAVQGDKLVVRGPRAAAAIAAELCANKAEIVALLQSGPPAEPLALDVDPDGWPRNSLDPSKLTPCQSCGDVFCWWDIAGRQRCLKCDPPTTARRLATLAARLRTQARPRIRPQESPAGAGTNKVSTGGPTPYAGK